MTEKVKTYWVYGISLLFIVLNAVLIVHEFYWALLVPLVAVLLLMYIFSLDKLLLFIVFATPLAINIESIEANLGISLPTEPLMFGVLIFFIVKIFGGFPYDRRVMRHPLTLAILLNLAWILITTFTSELPVVSIKFLMARLWFVIPFYFVAVILFRKFSNTKRFIWLYVIGLMIVIGYTLVRHAQFGFTEVSGHWVMTPFYNDHTAYGAAIAMFIPFIFGFIFDKSYSFSVRATTLIVFLVLMAAIILSYSRAAWVSVIVALIVYFIVLLKIKFKWLLTTFVILLVAFFSFQHQILEVLERNEQDSSTDFVEHVQSIYNISSDASNLERINRWQAGLRMFRERPFLGWGPGTYQFLYAPFQRSKEKTIISTNAGDLGNAHSEYIGPMAEQGLPGLLTLLLVLGIGIYTGLKVYHRATNPEVRLMALLSVLALIAYFVHGFLNNFLDTDKASVPVWGFFAIILALDLYHTDEKRDVY
ncbi:MAG TPA: O-antigen ligase family protein [Bacteroidales bacterium]|nr:O-antigen ligase family protein [Bacteroidales bacterium]